MSDFYIGDEAYTLNELIQTLRMMRVLRSFDDGSAEPEEKLWYVGRIWNNQEDR